MQRNSVTSFKTNSGFRGRKGEFSFEHFVPILGMMSSNFFFMMYAIIGFEYAGIEESRAYLYYMGLVLVANVILFFRSLAASGGRISSRELLVFLMVGIVALSYLKPTLLSGRVNTLATRFFLFFILFSLPAMLAALYLVKMRTMFAMVKLLEVLMLLLTLSIITNVVLPFIQGYRLLTFAGAPYHQIGSYLSAFSFGLNLYFLFNGQNHERFALFRSHFYKYCCISLIAIQFLGVLLPGGRGGAVLFLVYFLYLTLSQIAKKNVRSIIKVMIFVLLFVIALILIWPSLMNNPIFLTGYLRILEFVDVGGGINWEGTSGRDVVYKTTLQFIEQKPILGYGIFGMWDVYYSYPHNLFLEILLQGGVVYLVIMISLLFLFTRKLVHLIRKDRRYKILVVLFMYPFVMLMFSGTYLSTPMFWFVIVIVLNIRLKTVFP